MKPPKNQKIVTKTGRPTAFRPEYCRIAEKICQLGATDIILAEAFGVCEKTINNWKKAHPDFLESITRGKHFADEQVGYHFLN